MQASTYHLKPFVSNGSQVSCTFCIENDSAKLDFNVTNRDSFQIDAAKHLQERKDELWHSTCFELFIKAARSDCYIEWNLSPSGFWQCYQFETYRGTPLKPAIKAPTLLTSQLPGTFPFMIPWKESLELLGKPNHVLIAPTAIIKQEEDESLSYWAIEHPKVKPDFHSETGFRTITLGKSI